jgi:hypothetical protein
MEQAVDVNISMGSNAPYMDRSLASPQDRVEQIAIRCEQYAKSFRPGSCTSYTKTQDEASQDDAGFRL